MPLNIHDHPAVAGLDAKRRRCVLDAVVAHNPAIRLLSKLAVYLICMCGAADWLCVVKYNEVNHLLPRGNDYVIIASIALGGYLVGVGVLARYAFNFVRGRLIVKALDHLSRNGVCEQCLYPKPKFDVSRTTWICPECGTLNVVGTLAEPSPSHTPSQR